ncbi:MAG: hypothetical protein ACK47B_02035 [Armatimonadota bacterium]
MRHFLTLLSVLGCVVAPAAGVGAAAAEAARLGIRVENATAPEAIRRLSEASGVRLTLPAYAQPLGMPQGALAERASFDWSAATFNRALRELCARYGLRPQRRGPVYQLMPGGFAEEGPPLKPFGLVVRDGVRFYMVSTAIHQSRSRNLAGVGGNRDSSGTLTLHFAAELGELDRDQVYGLANVVARDDTGQVLARQGEFRSPPSFFEAGFPDRWSGSVSLPGPDPRARRLTWVEGELLVHRTVRRSTVELELPESGKAVRKQIGETLVVVSGYGPPSPEELPVPPGEEDLPQIRRRPSSGERTIRLRVFAPAGPRSEFMEAASNPLLAGASGELYPSSGHSWGGGGDGDWQFGEGTISFRLAEGDRPAKLIWDTLERSEPVPLLTFRIPNVPLPEPLAAPAAGPGRQPAEDPDRQPAAKPLHSPDGVAVSSPVRLSGRPAPAGTLQIGMAAERGKGWGPLRWMSVPVEDGTARLSGVRPGRYRVLRSYRPGEEALPTGGRWTGDELVVQVEPGKELVLPPLEWSKPGVSAAPKKPAAARPAPKKPAGARPVKK